MTSDTQLAALITEYAEDPRRSIEEVALKLQISPPYARRLMKKFAYVMAGSFEEPDFPKHAAREMGVSEDACLALQKHIDTYADMNMVQKMKYSDWSQRGGRGTSAADSRQTMFSPEEMESPTARLAGSNPTKLMRWILENDRNLERRKVESFMNFFIISEDDFLNNPAKLADFMTRSFGMKEGMFVFGQFSELARNMLGPQHQQAWSRLPPMGSTGTDYNAGPQRGYSSSVGNQPWNSGYKNFWQAKGVIPEGVDPNSPEAIRAIDEYQKRERLQIADEEISNKIKHALNVRMTEMVDPKNLQAMGGGMGMAGGMGYVGMGLRPVQRRDEKGEWITDWVPMGYGMMGGGGGGDGHNDTVQTITAVVEMVKTIMTMNQGNSLTDKFVSIMVDKFANGGGGGFGTDPVQTMLHMKEMADKLNPPVSFQQTVDVARLALAEKRIDKEADVAMKRIDAAKEETMADKNWERQQESTTATRANSVLDTVLKVVGEQFGPILGGLVAQKTGLGGLMGGGGGGPGGPGGPPPMLNQGGGADNGDIDYGGWEPPARFGPGGGGGGGGGPAVRPPGRPISEDDIQRYSSGARPVMTESERREWMDRQRIEDERHRAEVAHQAEQMAYSQGVPQNYGPPQQQQGQHQQPIQEEQQQNNNRQETWQHGFGPREFRPEDFAEKTDDELSHLQVQGDNWITSATSFSEAVQAARYQRNIAAQRGEVPQMGRRGGGEEEQHTQFTKPPGAKSFDPLSMAQEGDRFAPPGTKVQGSPVSQTAVPLGDPDNDELEQEMEEMDTGFDDDSGDIV